MMARVQPGAGGGLADLLLRYLGCPCALIDPQPNARRLMELYRRAFQAGRIEGFVPVIVSVDEREHLLEALVANAGAQAQRAEAFSARQVRAYRDEMLRARLPEGADVLAARTDEMGLVREAQEFGSAPKGECVHEGLLSAIDPCGDGEATKRVILAEVPVRHPWEVFAWLPAGGWNACPDPLQMMAVAKSWHERFGAFPAAISGDEVEFFMEQPAGRDMPSAQLDDLAMEHYAFAPDTWGSRLIDRSALQNCRYWYFWWD